MKRFLSIWSGFFVIVLYPFIRYLGVYLIPFVRRRYKFEQKNANDKFARSFKMEQITADIALEISSEGELEQVRPIIDHFLEVKKKVELIYCSESVEDNCRKLAKKYPEQIRCLRLALLSSLPWHKYSVLEWTSAPILILCRYDFFPELFIYGLKPGVKFWLVSGYIGNKGKSHLSRIFWSKVYRSFDGIVSPVFAERKKIKKLLSPKKRSLLTIEFRCSQIEKRLENAAIVLKKKNFYEQFNSILSEYPKDRRIIFGSAWTLDLNQLNDFNTIDMILHNQLMLTIVPHQLDEKSIKQQVNKLKSILGKVKVYVIRETTPAHDLMIFWEDCKVKNERGIFILAVKGILCELYGLYGHAYVGGGHGRSIHSVLEPYMANCFTYVGPKVHRSTEFELFSETAPDEIEIVNNAKEFQQVLKENLCKDVNRQRRMDSQLKMGQQAEKFYSLLEDH